MEPLSPAPVVRSEGQRLLLQVAGTQAAIGRELGGVPRQLVHAWQQGQSAPTVSARAKLEATFGIPLRSWFTLPGSGGTLAPAAPAPPPPPPAAAAPVEPVDQVQLDQLGNGTTTLAYVRKLLATVQRDAAAPDILPTERIKLANAEARILALHAKVEVEAQLAEARFVLAHPSWLRLRRTIVQALEPHPLAAAAVVAAIEAMEREQ